MPLKQNNNSWVWRVILLTGYMMEEGFGLFLTVMEVNMDALWKVIQ